MKNLIFILSLTFGAFHASYSMIAHIVVTGGTKDEIKFYRCLGPNINEPLDRKSDFQNYRNYTPLQIVCKKGNATLAELLLILPEIEPNKCLLGTLGTPPLHLAIQQPNNQECQDIISFLMAHKKTDINLPNSSQNTPLHFACLYNNAQAVEKLLDHPNIDINAKNERKTTPLHIACQEGLITIVKLLVGKKCEINTLDKYSASPLSSASQNGYAEIVRILLENGADTTLGSQSEPGTPDWSPIQMACKKNHLDVVTTLLEYNPDLMHIKIPSDNCSLLHIAAYYGSLQVLQYLLTIRGIDLYPKNNSPDTPLHMSCYQRDDLAVQALLTANKSGIDMQNIHGLTALHACMSPNKQKRFISNSSIDKLLKAGASTIIKNNNQRTALAQYYFTEENENDLDDNNVRQMIAGMDENGNNQLHLYATAQNPSDQYLDYLVRCGLSVWSRNNNGETPADLACKEYNKTRDIFISKPILAMKDILDNQERVMHSYLGATSARISCGTFKELFKIFHLLPEAQQRIMKYYYALNVETVIARQRSELTFKKIFWKDLSLEEKNEGRKNLIEYPHWPHALWRNK